MIPIRCILLPLLMLVFAAGCGEEDPQTRGVDPRFGAERLPKLTVRQVGYFKQGSNRIKTYELVQPSTAAAVRAHAEGEFATPGQLFAAYYYDAGSSIPADGVTLANDLIQASDVIYEAPGLSKWRYAFMRAFTGEVLFVDCTATPRDDLCRQD